MKLRNVFWEKYLQSITVPAVLFVFFYRYNNKIFGIIQDRPTFFRSFRMFSSFLLSAMVYLQISCYPWPSKHLHDVITQPEPNGKYFRKTVSQIYPRNWGMISKQLHDMGYNFREMNEYDEKEVMPDVTDRFDNTYY
jgi:hypothetical protein